MQACPQERKRGGRVLQGNKATPKPSSPAFPSHVDVSFTSPSTLVSQSSRGMAYGKESVLLHPR